MTAVSSARNISVIVLCWAYMLAIYRLIAQLVFQVWNMLLMQFALQLQESKNQTSREFRGGAWSRDHVDW